MFKSIRLSYLDDLDKNPNIQKALEELDVSNEFIFGLTDSNGWNKSVIDQIPEIELWVKNKNLICKSLKGKLIFFKMIWGRTYSEGYFQSYGEWGVLGHEVNKGHVAIWHKRTKTIIFIEQNLLNRMNSDPDFKKLFLTNLKQTIEERLHV